MSIGNAEFNFLVSLELECRRNEGLPVDSATSKKLWDKALHALVEINKVTKEQCKDWTYPSEWDNEIEGE